MNKRITSPLIKGNERGLLLAILDRLTLVVISPYPPFARGS